jgi:tetratricopeptide (TPR) repeat protein
MAVFYYDLRMDEKAMSLYKRALAIMETTFGPVHPEICVIVYNLAILSDALNQYADAHAFYRRALSGFEQTVGAKDSHAQVARRDFSAFLRRTGRKDALVNPQESAGVIRKIRDFLGG